MQNIIAALEQMQKIDLEIGSVEEEQRQLLKDLDTITEQIATANDSLAILTDETGGLKTQAREIDEKITSSDEKIKKDEQRISSIKNNRELSALNKEISAANKTKKQSEEDKERLNAKISDKNNEAAELQKYIETKTEALKTVTEQIENKRSEWKNAVEERLSKKEAAGADVPASIRKKYENIRAKRSGTALALIKNETCQGCFIHIPPQIYIQLKRGVTELVTCPHCHRILYVETGEPKEAKTAL